MMLNIEKYFIEVINVVKMLGGNQQHLEKIRSVFEDLEMDIGYLDQKRDEAETNLRVLLSSLEADRIQENSPSYEQKQKGQNY